jgi:hypothetical protein
MVWQYPDGTTYLFYWRLLHLQSLCTRPHDSGRGGDLKLKLALAGLFAAAMALTPAQATSVVFNTTSTSATLYASGSTIASSSPTGYTASIYGFDGVFTATQAPSSESVKNSSPTTLSNGAGSEELETTTAGLGIQNTGGSDPGWIGFSDAVVIDFSTAHPVTLANSTATFDMKIDASGPSEWAIYGFNGTNYVLLQTGEMQTGGPGTVPYSPTPSYTTTTSGLYSAYMIGVTNDCALTVTQVDVTPNQQTPEPGTFVMAGMALVAVGLTMKKRRKA